jgi:hypothetical protein
MANELVGGSDLLTNSIQPSMYFAEEKNSTE